MFIPKSKIVCQCGLTALRCTAAKLRWEKHLTPPYDAQGRRHTLWLCPACQESSRPFPLPKPGVHSRRKLSTASDRPLDRKEDKVPRQGASLHQP